MEYQGIIFDFNGTLFFDNDKHVKAWNEISKILRGKEITLKELHTKLNGTPNIQNILYFTDGKATKEDQKKYSQKKEEYYRKFCKEDKDSFHLVDGVCEFFDYLKEKGITENPILKVLNIEGEELQSTGNLKKNCNSIMTLPIELGYKNKHQLLATFELPFVFRALSGILWVELIFMIGFIFCLVWQWCSIRMTVRSARIQTMGMTHLEHELKKPLATMISVVNGILEGKDSVLCPRDTTKLTMVKARLMKMADITDTMLTSLKTSVLMINREVIDLKFEMEMTTEMFSLIRPYARVGYRIAEGLEYPCLDKIYFNYVVVNLVDNAIKYGGTHPVVKVDFYTIGDNYVLTVEDNGMGIAPKDQKQIFKQFYRVKNQQVTKTTGFGLGLTFVHKVVCAYGGSIRLESELGIGSKFTITIPQ